MKTLFLASLFAGVACLVAAIAVARLNWRPDVAPFDRRTNSVKVLARPEQFAAGSSLGLIRALTAVGYGLLGVASLSVIYQMLVNMIRQ